VSLSQANNVISIASTGDITAATVATELGLKQNCLSTVSPILLSSSSALSLDVPTLCENLVAPVVIQNSKGQSVVNIDSTGAFRAITCSTNVTASTPGAVSSIP